jgi:hypothetical protein
MQLNIPPPGAGRTREIVPAVLRSPTLGRGGPSSSGVVGKPADALGAMLRGSSSWDSVGTTVTWTVTLVSWLLLGLDIAAIFVTRAFSGGSDIFSRVLTWNDHPSAVISVAVIATIVTVTTAAMTHGLRRANLMWLRVWIGGAITSCIAIAAMLIALVLGLVFIAIGIVVCAVGVFLVGAGLAGAFSG